MHLFRGFEMVVAEHATLPAWASEMTAWESLSCRMVFFELLSYSSRQTAAVFDREEMMEPFVQVTEAAWDRARFASMRDAEGVGRVDQEVVSTNPLPKRRKWNRCISFCHEVRHLHAQRLSTEGSSDPFCWKLCGLLLAIPSDRGPQYSIVT